MEKFETKLTLVFRKDGSFDTRIGMNLRSEEMLTFNFLYDGLWFRNSVCDCRILVKLKWEIFIRQLCFITVKLNVGLLGSSVFVK